MKNIFYLSVLACCLCSCASIVTKSNYPVVINSNPQGAKVVITNRGGKELLSGTTPASLSLKASSGYMRGETYAVKISLEGHETQTLIISSQIEGWYYGNILLGGLIGMLIVDPLTGAMFCIKENNYHANLKVKVKNNIVDTAEGIQIIDINTLDTETRKQLVKLD